jgi:hypothetical protein
LVSLGLLERVEAVAIADAIVNRTRAERLRGPRVAGYAHVRFAKLGELGHIAQPGGPNGFFSLPRVTFPDAGPAEVRATDGYQREAATVPAWSVCGLDAVIASTMPPKSSHEA